MRRSSRERRATSRLLAYESKAHSHPKRSPRRVKVFVVPDGFAGAGPQGGEWITREEVAVADPAAGQLTNDHDRAVIRSLTGVAERSTAATPSHSASAM